MVQLKDGDCASFHRNVIYLVILGERKPTCSSVTLLKVFPLSLHCSRDTHTPPELQTKPWARAVAASLLLQGAATAGTEIIRRAGRQQEREEGMTEQV